MGKNRNKKGLRKYRIRLLILVIFLIVVSVFLYMANRDRYPHPDLLPEGSEAENLLHDITFAGGVKFPEQREAMIYCNKVDQKESLRRAARCLGLEVSDFSFRENSAVTMFDTYDVPEGQCAFEKGTGYWRYESGKGFPSEGVKREAFISDKELMKMTEQFIRDRGIFEEGQYTVKVSESTQGDGDAGELVLSKDVSVYPLIDGCEVWGVYRLIFSFDFRGEIAGISSYFNPPEEYEAVPLKEEAAAKKLLERGQYFTDNTEPLYGVEISEVSLVYYSDSNPEESGFLLYPVYVFYGTGHPLNSEEQVSFAAAVDAIAG